MIAQMAELVDAQVSDTCIERCGGSSPLPGTKYFTLNNIDTTLNAYLINCYQ
jgi:hypothetical protein